MMSQITIPTDSVLNKDVSIFKNYKEAKNPITINLLTWLYSEKYKNEVEQIRATADKKERDRIKSQLPAITPSGVFSSRCNEGLIKHSGLVCIDIDYKGNEGIGNYNDLKKELCKIINVAYCGVSVSGTGYFCLIPIADPKHHNSHYKQLQKVFLEYKIVADKTSDVSRLRGYSYDPAAYVNHYAVPFKSFYQDDTPAPRKKEFTPMYDSSANDVRAKVERCILLITQNHIDITGSYSAWFEIGCSLASEFQEDGRNYFDAVSQYNSKYKTSATDRQFTACLRQNNNITIATFFNHCSQYGISYKIEKSPASHQPRAKAISQPQNVKIICEVGPGEPPATEPQSNIETTATAAPANEIESNIESSIETEQDTSTQILTAYEIELHKDDNNDLKGFSINDKVKFNANIFDARFENSDDINQVLNSTEPQSISIVSIELCKELLQTKADPTKYINRQKKGYSDWYFTQFVRFFGYEKGIEQVKLFKLYQNTNGYKDSKLLNTYDVFLQVLNTLLSQPLN